MLLSRQSLAYNVYKEDLVVFRVVLPSRDWVVVHNDDGANCVKTTEDSRPGVTEKRQPLKIHITLPPRKLVEYGVVLLIVAMPQRTSTSAQRESVMATLPSQGQR